MKKYGKIDRNQNSIVRGLREAYCSVQTLASVGDGCTDLLVGNAGENFLLEIKDPEQPPSKRRLTPDQVTWHENWRGQAAVVHTTEEALDVVFHRGVLPELKATHEFIDRAGRHVYQIRTENGTALGRIRIMPRDFQPGGTG